MLDKFDRPKNANSDWLQPGNGGLGNLKEKGILPNLPPMQANCQRLAVLANLRNRFSTNSCQRNRSETNRPGARNFSMQSPVIKSIRADVA